MDHSDTQAIEKNIRRAVMVFVILMVLTVVTVLAAQVDLGHTVNIVVALLIATVKGSLVAAYFMHLIDEKQVIYWVLILCAVFCVFMLGLLMFTNADGITL
ncbi:MAG: cytochrome C oxidase subunit IV family protein [Acidobacteriota bacterium]|nr:cytochrome C oxidase subunit IV family protein [Acidobacteriota bacterium]